MGKKAELLLFIFSVALAKPSHWHQICPRVMSKFGFDEYFGEAVAHRSHSLTLDDLRYYFKDDAPLDNGIPTINLDLAPKATRILANAPLIDDDTSFKTITMRHTDRVLSKMNRKNWGLKHNSVLEKIVHIHHMSEMWERSKTYYNIIRDSPPAEKLCSCVRDIEENGVLAFLQLLALKIKFPGLTSGNHDVPYGIQAQKKKSWSYDFSYDFSYSFSWGIKDAAKESYLKKLMNFDFEGDEEDVVVRAMKELRDGDKGQKHLTDEEAWNHWKEGFKGMDENDNKQFAMYIYCMLND